jgi:hypothetical protein
LRGNPSNDKFPNKVKLVSEWLVYARMVIERGTSPADVVKAIGIGHGALGGTSGEKSK